MGQSQSAEPSREVPVEQLSHELALRFASKCYSHLEIAHYKDNFKTLADHQEDLEYWKEDTLCRFLALPEPLKAGPVIYQMCTYLGAFPFPALAPCILTREAMLKIVTIMTGRYKKVLKRGDQDKAKLLFRSLAVFDRKASVSSPKEKPDMDALVRDQLPDDMMKEREVQEGMQSHASGFAIDEPANDDEDEDDDDLALAALDALDAIEVFKQDQRTDRKIHHAMIPADNLKKLIMFLLLIAGLEPLTPLGSYGDKMDSEKLQALNVSADATVAAFDPDAHNNGVRYANFVKTVATAIPELFDPLSNLFEHFLFSKNINLNKHRDTPEPIITIEPKPSPIYRNPEDDSYSIFTDTLLSQMSMSLKLFNPSGSLLNIFASGARFNRLYSSSSDGTSLSSFSRQVMSWQSGTLLLISGTLNDTPEPSKTITLGAYMPEKWHDPSSGSGSRPPPSYEGPKPCLFQLQPRQAVFAANPYNRTTPWSYFSNKTGIALGCVIPQQSRTNAAPLAPVLGPVGLLIDRDMSTATFQHDGQAGTGAFVTDPGLETAQTHQPTTAQRKKVEFDIDSLEVWGISFPEQGAGEDELTKQKKRLAWEEAEAARRRGVNFGGDKDGARALLEMAGLVGDKAGTRSGGSV
ncbi:TLD-domain-containing protein [Exophiala viscosa]|uniref:Restriction of telomere capping protein 5 n=1 Tax=Exophiala viscosa TaxID=2486360 RepID=A0AAN6IGA9_9EURO|nr:TLD-domain-containing protein [Exophiala viscosa]